NRGGIPGASFELDDRFTCYDARGIEEGGAYLGTPRITELPAYARFTDQINSDRGKLSRPYVSAVHAFKGPHAKPLKVFAWTVNGAAEARRLTEMGADGIITNAPDVVRKAVTAH
ncbi:glycerophosphodiester phosphodiesterase, partial [Streptomyces sp. NPDC004290]